MNRIFLVLTGLILFYLIYGVYLAQYRVAILPEDLAAENPRGYLDYRGITNVRGVDSNEIIESAQAAGLDFLSITDLNIFDPPAVASYHNNLLVMKDGEYSYLNSRLLRLAGSSGLPLKGVGRAQVMFADLLSQEHKDPELGMLILAHPMKDQYRWSGDYPPGLDGIELINLKEVWNEAWSHNKWSFLMSLLIFPFNEKLALLRLFSSPQFETQLWDDLSQKRRMIGIAGAGAEGKLSFPTYQTLFSLVRDHVLLRSEFTGSIHGDLEKLTSAIRQGQFYICLDILGDPKGFNVVARAKDGQAYPMGSEILPRDDLELEIVLPQKPSVPFETVIYRNGERAMTSNSQTTRFIVKAPGVYRVLVRVIPTLPLPDGKKWIPWIYTNPFYIRSGSAGSPGSTIGGSGTRTTSPPKGGN